MTKPKQVAKTIKSAHKNPTVEVITDRQQDVTTIIDKVINYWGFDLFSRKPGAAYKDGVFVGTDLDMAVFLYALADRGAVINIPEYENMRQTRVKEGTMLSSKENRHGKIQNLVSNKDTFIFSLRIMDMNVMTSDTVGEFRTFSLTTFDGSWYSGWKQLKFMPDAKENEFIKKTKILSGPNKITFNNFIHPNRWTSMYGQYYIITKMLIDRLTQEAQYYFKHIKAMKAEGIEYPDADTATAPKQTYATGEKKSIKVDAFEAVVDYPDNNTTFPEITYSQEELVRLTDLRTKWVYGVLPKLRFMTRATEFAFNKHVEEKGLSSFPTWIKDAKWEENYKPKGKRTLWNRFVFYQPVVGQTGLAIRFRKWQKSERVDIDYEG